MMLKRILIALIIYLLISVFAISPYLSSFVFIKYINQFLETPATFGIDSYLVFIEQWIQRAEFSNQHLLKGILFGSIAFLFPFGLLVLIMAVVGVALIAQANKKYIHGNARLANDIDLSKSLFFKKKDHKYPAILIGKIPKGRYKGRYIKYYGQQFLMLYAPTRSGKGVGIVLPNCFYYPESMVVLDIKLENFLLTAGHRQDNLGQEVFLFSPAGWEQEKGVFRSHRYNPLSVISRDLRERHSDVSKISAIFFAKTGGENDMWTGLTSNLFTGLVLFLLDCENETNDDGSLKFKVALSQVLKLSIPENGDPLGKYLKEEISNRNSPKNIEAWDKFSKGEGERPKLNRLDDETVRLLLQFANNTERQQMNILLTFFDEMKIFANPITAYATDESDIDVKAIRRKKMSVYYGLSPNTISVYKKLTNVFFSQLISENVGLGNLPEQDPTIKYQCLLMLDEFMSMGRVEIIKEAVAYSAGYNMRFIFILQDRNQLEDQKAYGKEGAEVLVSNCAVELVYPPKDVTEHVKRVSESIGYYDFKQRTVSRNKGKEGSATHGEQIHKRAVLLPQEIVELRDKKYKDTDLSVNEIIMSEFCRPILAEKIIYFDDPFFKERKEYSENNIPHIPVLEVAEDEVMSKVLEGKLSLLVDDLKDKLEQGDKDEEIIESN